jgi:hypothetical protein
MSKYKFLDRIDLDNSALLNLIENVLPVEYEEHDINMNRVTEIARVFVDGQLRLKVFELPHKAIICRRIYGTLEMSGWLGWCDNLNEIRALEKEDLVTDDTF